MMGLELYQLDHIKIICTSLQTNNQPVPHHKIFTGQMLFPTHSTEGNQTWNMYIFIITVILKNTNEQK